MIPIAIFTDGYSERLEPDEDDEDAAAQESNKVLDEFLEGVPKLKKAVRDIEKAEAGADEAKTDAVRKRRVATLDKKRTALLDVVQSLSLNPKQIDSAVEETIKAKFATSGQDCLGANRFYIHRPIYDEFCARFPAAVEGLRLAPGIEDADLGPLIHDRQVAKQQAHVDDALARGARLLTGGAVASELGPLFYKPTVLADVPDEAAIMREETFGPVAALTPFDTEDEVIARANASEYGLIAYLHSQDPRRIYRLSRALQYGMVAVNRSKVTGAPIPFGGMKQSGLGREGARQGLEAFTEIKYVCRDWA